MTVLIRRALSRLERTLSTTLRDRVAEVYITYDRLQDLGSYQATKIPRIHSYVVFRNPRVLPLVVSLVVIALTENNCEIDS